MEARSDEVRPGGHIQPEGTNGGIDDVALASGLGIGDALIPRFMTQISPASAPPG